MQEQKVFINLDDSGKLTKNESFSVYGGLVFLSKKEKDKFITQYRIIINDIKNHYHNNAEIKNINILPKDKRRIINYLKKYYLVGLIINNNDVYNHIIENKAAKGRFIDYAIRRMIKDIVKELISNNTIDSYQPISIIINIDEQTTKSNGYYDLKEGIKEELKYGINNFNYESVISPIIYSELDLALNYRDSKKSFVIQAADLLAGTIRKSIINNDNFINIINYILIIPPRKKATK